ncbi:hypothetical protein V8J82_09080 [Gymnodinialimonas sp. 2305UL16-5]|uniref:hypothetical protein n=1 Tax=Gymnodinialimonas mytili TaxID=3126503 RepID=UPI0030A9FD1C
MTNIATQAAFIGAAMAMLCLPAWANDPDPITAEPDAFAARVALPDSVALPDGSVMATLSATMPETGQQTHETYVMTRAEEEEYYVLTEADRTRLRQQQMLILGYREAGLDVDGTFSFAINPCLTGEGNLRNARVSIELRADETVGFFPVVDDMRLRRLLGQQLRTLPPCS